MGLEKNEQGDAIDDVGAFDNPDPASSAVVKRYYDAISEGKTITLQLSQLDDIIASISFLQSAVMHLNEEVISHRKSPKGYPLKSDFDDAMNNSFRTLEEMTRVLVLKVARGEQ